MTTTLTATTAPHADHDTMGFTHPALVSNHYRTGEPIPFTAVAVGCTDRDEYTVRLRYAGPGRGLHFGTQYVSAFNVTFFQDGAVGFTNLHTYF